MFCNKNFNFLLNERILNGTSNAFKISESQKCCMYNTEWRTDFFNARHICLTFNSNLYSLKTKGYKTLLENYADYLNLNFDVVSAEGPGHITADFHFWTSCIRDQNDPHLLDKTVSECLHDDLKLNDFRYNLKNPTIDNDQMNILYVLSKQAVPDMGFLAVNLVYQFVDNVSDLLLDSVSFGHGSAVPVDQDNNGERHNTCLALLKIPIKSVRRSHADIEHTIAMCVQHFYLHFTKQSVLLVKRQATSAVLDTQTTMNLNGTAFSGADCFASRSFDESTHLSIPFLTRCYHVTIRPIVGNHSQHSLAFYYDTVYSQAIRFHNFNLQFEIVDQVVLHKLLNLFGILAINCSAPLRPNGKSKVLLVAKDLALTADLMATAHGFCKQPLLNGQYLFHADVVKFDGFSSQQWLGHVRNDLEQGDQVLVLHSYTNIEKRIRLGCLDTLHDVDSLIHDCIVFYNDYLCAFTCPTNCTLRNRMAWQVAPFVYNYFSEICTSAVHAGLFMPNNSINRTGEQFEGVLLVNCTEHNNVPLCHTRRVLNSNRKSDDSKHLVIDHHGITANLWPPPSFVNTHKFKAHADIQYFFRTPISNPNRFDPNRYATAVKTSTGSDSVIVKALYDPNEPVVVFYNFDSANINMHVLWPPTDNGPSDVKYTNRESHRSVLLENENPNYLNRYFRIESATTAVNFPINFRNPKLVNYLPNLHVVTMRPDQTKHLGIKNRNMTSGMGCTWYFMNIDSGVKCEHDLKIVYETIAKPLNIIDYSKQNLIVYPNMESTEPVERFFTRILFAQSDRINCKYGLVASNTTGACTCLPGFSGKHCDRICANQTFGNECTRTCPNSDCMGYLICVADPVGCMCAPGYTGFECTQTCENNSTWGPNCQFTCGHCQTKTCSIFTGACVCATNNQSSPCESCNCQECPNADCAVCDECVSCLDKLHCNQTKNFTDPVGCDVGQNSIQPTCIESCPDNCFRIVCANRVEPAIDYFNEECRYACEDVCLTVVRHNNSTVLATLATTSFDDSGPCTTRVCMQIQCEQCDADQDNGTCKHVFSHDDMEYCKQCITRSCSDCTIVQDMSCENSTLNLSSVVTNECIGTCQDIGKTHDQSEYMIHGIIAFFFLVFLLVVLLVFYFIKTKSKRRKRNYKLVSLKL